ncbi:MAG: ABC transporter substrate-binding protein [Chloroflexi bacterium]|nr:ABC transporter substrate-binding protein [Chloroflexota bacterium]
MRLLGRSNIVIVVLILVVIAACAPAMPTAAPAKPTAAPTAADKPAAPAAAPATAAKIKRGGTLVTANAVPATMDPIYDTVSTVTGQMGVYETLVEYLSADLKDGNFKFVGVLAESWEQQNPTTLVLKLRKGVKFHDGSDFDASVAKWSLERMATATKSFAKRHGQNFDKLEVVDPYTLKIIYKQPSALHLFNLSSGTGGTGSVGPVILSKAQMDNVGEDAFGNGKASGTGPFKLTDYKQGDVATTVKNENYWGKGADGQPLPYLDGIKIRTMNDLAVQFTELRAGTLHLTHAPKPADLPTLRQNSDLVIVQMKWAPLRGYYGFNQWKEPWGKNAKLRQAAQYATDRENYTKVMNLEAGTPDWIQGWPTNWPGYDQNLGPVYKFDPEKAAALVKEAGFPNGVDILLTHDNNTTKRKQAELLQGMWLKAGIRVTLEALEVVAARQKMKAGNFDMHQWDNSPSPDPAYASRMFVSDGSAQLINYNNADVDKCFADGEREMDPAKRNETYRKCQQIVQEDDQIAGLNRADTLVVFRKEVQGVQVKFSYADLTSIWLDK